MKKFIYCSILTFTFIISGLAKADLAECLQQAEDAYKQCKDSGGGEVGCQAKKDKIEAQCVLDNDS